METFKKTHQQIWRQGQGSSWFIVFHTINRHVGVWSSWGSVLFIFWLWRLAPKCACQSEWVCPCLCEHASFSSPLARTMARGEVLRCSQSREQCEGRRVPRREVVFHARALDFEDVRRLGGNQVKCLACHSPIWLPAVENGFKREGESVGSCSPAREAECHDCRVERRRASGADWTRTTSVRWLFHVVHWDGGQRPRPKQILPRPHPCVF